MIISGASLNFKQDILNHFLCNTPVTSPTTLYIALFNGDPVNKDGTELQGNGYERRQITFSTPNNGEVANTEDIEFGPALQDWGTVTHTAVFTDATEGKLLLYGEIARPRELLQNDTFIFLAGDYKVSIVDEQGV